MLDGHDVLAAAAGDLLEVLAVDVERVGGDGDPVQVAVAAVGVRGLACGCDVAGQRQDLGDLCGVLGDAALADDDALAVDQGGEQLHLAVAQLFPGALEDLPVQGHHQGGRVSGRDPPGGHLGEQPAAGEPVGLVSVDHLDVAADRGLFRRDVAALHRVVAGAEAGQCLLRQVSDEVRGGAEAAAATGQPGCGHHRQRRSDLVPDAALGAGVGQAAEDLQQAGAVPGQRQRVQVDHAGLLAREKGMAKRRGQDLRRAAVQRVDPDPLGAAVMMPGPGAAAVAERLPDLAEVRRRVAGAGVAGRVGERLHRQHPVPVGRQVIGWQPPQQPGQHRRGEIVPLPARQHAEPLVIHDVDQPGVLLLAGPPDEPVPRGAAQRGRPEPGDRDPLPVQLGHIPQHLPGQPVPEPVMRVQLSAEPAGFPEGHRPDRHIRDTGTRHARRSTRNPGGTPVP